MSLNAIQQKGRQNNVPESLTKFLKEDLVNEEIEKGTEVDNYGNTNTLRVLIYIYYNLGY